MYYTNSVSGSQIILQLEVQGILYSKRLLLMLGW